MVYQKRIASISYRCVHDIYNSKAALCSLFFTKYVFAINLKVQNVGKV